MVSRRHARSAGPRRNAAGPGPSAGVRATARHASRPGWTPPSRSPSSWPRCVPSSNGSRTAWALPDKAILDITRLEEAFEDDTAGIAELLEMALETGKKHRAALEEGLAAGDAAVVARAAHGIKGSAGNIGANVVYGLATELG